MKKQPDETNEAAAIRYLSKIKDLLKDGRVLNQKQMADIREKITEQSQILEDSRNFVDPRGFDPARKDSELVVVPFVLEQIIEVLEAAEPNALKGGKNDSSNVHLRSLQDLLNVVVERAQKRQSTSEVAAAQKEGASQTPVNLERQSTPEQSSLDTVAGHIAELQSGLVQARKLGWKGAQEMQESLNVIVQSINKPKTDRVKVTNQHKGSIEHNLRVLRKNLDALNTLSQIEVKLTEARNLGWKAASNYQPQLNELKTLFQSSAADEKKNEVLNQGSINKLLQIVDSNAAELKAKFEQQPQTAAASTNRRPLSVIERFRRSSRSAPPQPGKAEATSPVPAAKEDSLQSSGDSRRGSMKAGVSDDTNNSASEQKHWSRAIPNTDASQHSPAPVAKLAPQPGEAEVTSSVSAAKVDSLQSRESRGVVLS